MTSKDKGSSVDGGNRFAPTGIVLAGGFVKHPWPWGPNALRRMGTLIPHRAKKLFLKSYKLYAGLRHRNAAETLAGVDEFIARRNALDQMAMHHRLQLLDEYDPRPVAQRTTIPIHYLAGFIDPLVPYPLVRSWLGKNCPGYRGGKTFWRADHNVLATAPQAAAKTILQWLAEAHKVSVANDVSR